MGTDQNRNLADLLDTPNEHPVDNTHTRDLALDQDLRPRLAANKPTNGAHFSPECLRVFCHDPRRNSRPMFPEKIGNAKVVIGPERAPAPLPWRCFVLARAGGVVPRPAEGNVKIRRAVKITMRRSVKAIRLLRGIQQLVNRRPWVARLPDPHAHEPAPATEFQTPRRKNRPDHAPHFGGMPKATEQWRASVLLPGRWSGGASAARHLPDGQPHPPRAAPAGGGPEEPDKPTQKTVGGAPSADPTTTG